MKAFSFIIIFILTAIPDPSKIYRGTIIQVIDGDTYVFRTREGSFRVRSFGIDAPEGNQPFGKESAAFLSGFINEDAELIVKSTDRYKRKLGTLFIKGQDINLLEVRKGYAWLYNRYLSDPEYTAAQDYARKHRLGLWKQADPVAPWKWRHFERVEGTFHHR